MANFKINVLFPASCLLFFGIMKMAAQEEIKAQQEEFGKNDYYKSTIFKSDKVGGKDKKIFELTEEEQNRIPKPPKPVAKNKLTAEKISELKAKDPKKFEFALDGAAFPISDIEKKADKVAYYQTDYILLKKRTPEKPQEYRINFYTDAGYEKNFPGDFPAAPTVIDMKDYAAALQSKQPEFPGGMPAFEAFIAKNFKIPTAAQGQKLNSRIMVRFVVDTDGSLSGFKVIRDIGFETGKEAVRVLENSPKWIPAMENGKPVKTEYTVPIMINNLKK